MTNTANEIFNEMGDAFLGFRAYWKGFTATEAGGVDGVSEAYEIAFNFAKGDYKALSELAIALFWKSYDLLAKGDLENQQLAIRYFTEYGKVFEYAHEILNGKELEYFNAIDELADKVEALYTAK